MSDHFSDHVKASLRELESQGYGTPRPKRPLMGAASGLFSETFPETPWLVRGLLQQVGVCFLAGEPKTAKTWHAMELALAVATSTKAFGEFQVPRPRDVCLFLVESDRRESRNRLRALSAAREMDPEVASQRIRISCRQSLNLGDPIQVAQLIASVQMMTSDCGLLVLDCLRDLHTGKENEADSMAPVMQALRALREILKCCIVVVHHSRKSGEGDNGRPGQRMRGSSVIHATGDAGLYLHDHKGDGQSHWISKVQSETRDVRSAGTFWTRLDVDDDDGGEAIHARWEVSRQAMAAAENDMDERAETILGVLVEERRRAGRPVALNVNQLQAATNIHHKTVLKKVRALEGMGYVAETDGGLSWVATPAGDNAV